MKILRLHTVRLEKLLTHLTHPSPQPLATPGVARGKTSRPSPNNDVELIWQTDSKGAYVVRRTPAPANVLRGAHIYSLELDTGDAVPLVTDDDYSNGTMVLSPNGKVIAFQRFPIKTVGGRPEIWMYNVLTKELNRVVVNAVGPKWLP